jgi:hypothetical protein
MNSTTWKCPRPEHVTPPEDDVSWTCPRCGRRACASCEGSDDGLDKLCLACWTELDDLRGRWVAQVREWARPDAVAQLLSDFGEDLLRLAAELNAEKAPRPER